MKLVHDSETLRVLDDVLPPEAFSRLWRYQQSREYSFVQAERWYKTYRLGDGNPLESEVSVSNALPGAPAGSYYPTGQDIDLFIERLDAIVSECTEQIGKRGIDWQVYTCRSFLYPAGCALTWHNDRDRTTRRTGAYIFYTHPSWEVSWGGELLVQDSLREPPLVSTLDERALSDFLFDEGAGKFVFPRPNRLVLIKQGTLHAIAPVRAEAGNRVRCSLTGFFIAPQRWGES